MSVDVQTKDKPGSDGLYADHVKVYPRILKSGYFRRLKWLAMAVLLAIYYIAPFLRWDRGAGAPDQAILIDMPGRRAYFFWIEIWPQEVYYLTGLLILGAIGLFFVTALFGRIWCGYACPQTVWTDLYVWLESKFEGDRNARIKLDQGPMTFNKAWRKVAKHAAWLLVAVLTGGAWVLYFNDAPTIIPQIFTGDAGSGVYTFLALFTATTYVLAGWAREQVCIYMCPWPRFQAAMFDEHSLIVTYEAWRGEPRAPLKGGNKSFEGRGHCIDCKLCVQVCPTGIDIRNGSQLACIGCGLCIDACNSVMDRVGLPRNLITWDSIANQEARAEKRPTKVKWVRSRTVIYAVILALVAGAMLFTLSNRNVTEINVLHERSPLYVTLSSGDIRNGYTFKILNMIRENRSFTLSLDGIKGATMSVIGVADEGSTSAKLDVKGDSVGSFRVFVSAPTANLSGRSTALTFVLTETDGRSMKHETLFAGPER